MKAFEDASNQHIQAGKAVRKATGCKGYQIETTHGFDYACEYDTILICEDCKYGMGRKDPAAKCNQ